ncbi:hypothetical protein ACHAPC_011073 [Botrytis cinerea]
MKQITNPTLSLQADTSTSKPTPKSAAEASKAMTASDILLPKNTKTTPTTSFSSPLLSPVLPEPEPVSNTQVNAPLEKLPSEVRRNLLSRLQLEDLSALVHASPVFHQQYLLDRRFLLCTCLEISLHSSSSSIIDACAVYRTGLIDFSDARTHDKVIHFLQFYQDRRSSTEYSIFSEGLIESEIVEIAAFHSTIIKPLARQYTDWALTNLADETKNTRSITPLSKTEEMRLQRALYRFQLCCNLFGKNADSSQWFFQGLNFKSVDILTMFLCLFEPWEIEEILCLYTFSKEMYTQIFKEIHWDLDANNPKFDDQGRPPTPTGAFDLDDDAYLMGTISLGLKILHRVLITRDHDQRVWAMQEHICLPLGEFLESEGTDVLDEWTQQDRRRKHPSYRDQKELRRDPLPFEGDKELCPPLAWTILWQGTYSNRYGGYLEDGIRHWGYIMWDAVRLGETGGKEILARLWEERKSDRWSDPRDSR